MPARKRKPAPEIADVTAPSAVEPPAPAAAEPDVFDEAIAARAATPDGPAGADETRRAEAGPTAYQPDPFPFHTVPLGDGADAPGVRLFRNRRMNQVAVRFDEKPAEEVRQRMRDEGYKWREGEGVWTKQLGDHRATGQLAAERLVDEIGNAIRAGAGLPPVGRTPGE